MSVAEKAVITVLLSSEIGTVNLGICLCRLRGVNAMIDRQTFVGYTPVVHVYTYEDCPQTSLRGGWVASRQ
jgi:hypothetical protein